MLQTAQTGHHGAGQVHPRTAHDHHGMVVGVKHDLQRLFDQLFAEVSIAGVGILEHAAPDHRRSCRTGTGSSRVVARRIEQVECHGATIVKVSVLLQMQPQVDERDVVLLCEALEAPRRYLLREEHNGLDVQCVGQVCKVLSRVRQGAAVDPWLHHGEVVRGLRGPHSGALLPH